VPGFATLRMARAGDSRSALRECDGLALLRGILHSAVCSAVLQQPHIKGECHFILINDAAAILQSIGTVARSELGPVLDTRIANQLTQPNRFA